MKIRVTQRDIDLGIAQDCAQCPVARAVRRHPKLKEAEVYEQVVWCRKKRYWGLPIAAQAFIDKFDSGKRVQPFTFELPV